MGKWRRPVFPIYGEVAPSGADGSSPFMGKWRRQAPMGLPHLWGSGAVRRRWVFPIYGEVAPSGADGSSPFMGKWRRQAPMGLGADLFFPIYGEVAPSGADGAGHQPVLPHLW